MTFKHPPTVSLEKSLDERALVAFIIKYSLFLFFNSSFIYISRLHMISFNIYIYIYIYFKKNNETGFVVFLKEFIALYYWYIELFTRKILNIHSWITSCPDGITPNSGLTEPRILYIYIYICIYILYCNSVGCHYLTSSVCGEPNAI